MGNLEDSVEALKAERVINPKIAGDPGNGKTAEELKIDLLKKEFIENREAIEALKESNLKIHKVEPVLPLKEHTTEPIKHPSLHITCPFCKKQFTEQGMSRHIAAIHKAPGISVEDVDDMNKGKKSLTELLDEKGITTIVNLSPEVSKKHFSDWHDLEEPEINDQENKKEDLEDEAQEDRRHLNLYPPFSLFDRRKG